METVYPFKLPDFEDEWINQMEDHRSCERKSARDNIMKEQKIQKTIFNRKVKFVM